MEFGQVHLIQSAGQSYIWQPGKLKYINELHSIKYYYKLPNLHYLTLDGFCIHVYTQILQQICKFGTEILCCTTFYSDGV